MQSYNCLTDNYWNYDLFLKYLPSCIGPGTQSSIRNCLAPATTWLNTFLWVGVKQCFMWSSTHPTLSLSVLQHGGETCHIHYINWDLENNFGWVFETSQSFLQQNFIYINLWGWGEIFMSISGGEILPQVIFNP